MTSRPSAEGPGRAPAAPRPAPERAAPGLVPALGRGYARAVAALASVIMVVIVLVMGAQVFYRYVLNDSLIWAEEVSGYLLVVMTFLFIGAAFQRGEMVTIGFFVDTLPPRARVLLAIPSLVAMIGFLLVLAYYSLRFANLGRAYNIPAAGFIGSALAGPGADVQVSMYWLYLMIPAGCLILSGHLLVVLWGMLRAAAGRVDPADVLPRKPDALEAGDA